MGSADVYKDTRKMIAHPSDQYGEGKEVERLPTFQSRTELPHI